MHLTNAVSAVGFWLGTVLPVAYLPVFLSGIDSTGSLSLMVGLLAIHALALIVGRDYASAQGQSTRAPRASDSGE